MRISGSSGSFGRFVLAGIVGGGLALASTAGATTPGALTQLGGEAGCISTPTITVDVAPTPRALPEDGCATGEGFGSDVSAVAASPDGRNVYVANSDYGNSDEGERGAILVFARGAGGTLTQAPGEAACISDASGVPCTPGRALGGAKDLVVSPDGRHVYVAALGAEAIAVLDRNTDDGTLTQREGDGACVSDDGTANSYEEVGSCVDVRALGDVRSLALSPDGRFLYAIGGSTDVNAVVVFERHEDGHLTQLEGQAACISDDGTDGDDGPCADGRALYEPTDLVVSPDGRNIYVSVSEARRAYWDYAALRPQRRVYDAEDDHGPGAVVVLDRNREDGTISQPDGAAGCLTRMAGFNGAQREVIGECTEATGLEDAAAIDISPDGKNVYVAAQGGSNTNDYPGALTIFARDGEGRLAPLEGRDACVTRDGTDGTAHYEYRTPDPENPEGGPIPADDPAYQDFCRVGTAMKEPSGIAISPDGTNVYVMNEDDNAIAVFARDGGTGAVTQLAGLEGCISQDGRIDTPTELLARGVSLPSCADGRALEESTKMVVVGCSAYSVSPNSSALAAFSRCNPVTTVATDCSRSGQIAVNVAEGSGGAGAKTLHFRVGEGEEQTRTTSAADPGAVTLELPEGRHELQYWGEDEQGRAEASRSATIVVDRTDPAVAITGASEVVRGQAGTIDVTASDSGSGLGRDPSARGERVATDTDGEHVVERTAEDRCGNKRTATFRYRVVAPAEAVAPQSQAVPRVCASRRVISMRLGRRPLRGGKVRSVTATIKGVDRKLAVKRNGNAIRVTVDMRGIPKGRFTVAIKVKLADGTVVNGTRKYRTCTKKMQGGKPPLY